MLEVFCDESYDDTTYTVAGWAATPSAWGRFVPAWRRMLDEFGVQSFHAAELVGRETIKTSRYKGWSFEQERALFTRAVDLVTDKSCCAVMWPVGVSVHVPDDASWMGGGDTIWHLLFVRLFTVILDSYRAQNGISFTFDDKPEVKRHVNEFFSSAKGLIDTAFPGKLDRDHVGFQSDDECEPIQAADLLAYEWRKRLSDRVKKPSKPVRPPYARIRAARTEGALCYYDAAAIAEIKARSDAGESFVEVMWKYPTAAE